MEYAATYAGSQEYWDPATFPPSVGDTYVVGIAEEIDSALAVTLGVSVGIAEETDEVLSATPKLTSPIVLAHRTMKVPSASRTSEVRKRN